VAPANRPLAILQDDEFRHNVLMRELEIYRAATRELAEWLAAARRGETLPPPGGSGES